MDASTRRKIRQTLEIDRLMGLDEVPMSDHRLTIDVNGAASGRASTDDPARSALKQDMPRKTTPPPPPPRSARIAPPSPLAALPPIPPNSMTPAQKAAALEELAREHGEQCPHCCAQNRGQLNLVFGEGDPAAALMFVGEGPGEEEDRAGRPFVGRSGQLLDKQISAMGLGREQVYIANIVKIRPPGNRVPTPEEAQRCMPWLVRQIEIISPKVIVTLGATPSKYLLANPALAITRERGQWKEFRGIPVMPTFHPAYLLRAYTPENRRRVWEDLQKVMERLGLPVPGNPGS